MDTIFACHLYMSKVAFRNAEYIGIRNRLAGIHTKGGNMSDDISLAMEGALAVIAVVGGDCLVVFLMDRQVN